MNSVAPVHGVLENYERERVFGLFRQFGYLEAELNPLGLLPPQPHPDLRFDADDDNEYAREARRIYCGSVGVEFMHIADRERRQMDSGAHGSGTGGRRSAAARSSC